MTWAAPPASQAIFASPDEAAGALLAALESDDQPLFRWVAGKQMDGFWSAGEPERDVLDRARFLDAIREDGIRAEMAAADRLVLYLGRMAQPFPAPLVKTGSGWRFDGDAGARELTAQRIRRNEAAVWELCRLFHEAQYAYLRMNMSPGGDPVFAQRIRSTPGQRDGLFWSNHEGDESPLGPRFSKAAYAERQPADETQPLFGYYFKILAAQGPHAAGGAFDYRGNGGLHGGFALIAWPAKYGAGGLRSFLMNHLGELYQKDLGAETARIAERITVFDPDRSWSRFHADE